MTIEELKNRYGFNSKTSKVRCFKCWKELEMPNMLSEKLRKEVLRPYCPTGTVFTIGWLITHGWHCTRHEADPSGAFLCPDCYEEGTPEYIKTKFVDDWCKQAEDWMNGITPN